MKEENTIVTKAAEALKKQTGLLIKYRKSAAFEYTRIDYEIEVNSPSENKSFNYYGEVKKRLTGAAIGDLAILAKKVTGSLILISEYVTKPQAEKLRQFEVQFVDAAGNAFLNEPGLFVFISGEKAELKAEKPLSIFRPAGIKLVLAFLCQPGLENADYRSVNDVAGVPRSTVGELISDLEKAGYMIRRQKNQRVLTNKNELIRRWVEVYSEQFRVKLKPVRYRSTKHTGRWWEEVNIEEYKAVWGGEVGGEKLTNHLRPQTATIYADSTLPKLQAKYGLVRDKKGEIEILRKFWKFGEIDKAAPPLVVYADLIATADERNIETARLIYDEYLAPLTKEDSR
jgi:hypothetical protein